MINTLKSLKKHQGFMKYFRNTSWLFGEKILRMVVGLFVGIWVARYLGPEQFGLFSYAQSFVGLFTAIATLGLDGIVVRELVKDESRRDELIGTAFWLKLMGAVGVLLVLAVAVNFTSNDTHINILVFIIASATVFQSFNVIDFYFQSKVLSRFVVFANIISLFLSSLVKIALILNEAPLIAFAWVILFDSAVLACGFVYFYFRHSTSSLRAKRSNPLSSWKFNKQMAFSLLKESWPLVFISMASMMNMRMDQVMLGNMTSNEVVGNYAAAVRIAEIWLILPMLIGSSIFPALVSAKEHSLSLYRNRIFATAKYMAMFAIPFALTVSLLSGFIVNLLYGEAYSDAGLFLAMYIWTGLPYVVLFALSQTMVIEKLTHWSMYITIVVVFTNIVLNTILIPIYQGVGAIVSTLIVAYLAQGISLFIIYTKTKLFKEK